MNTRDTYSLTCGRLIVDIMHAGSHQYAMTYMHTYRSMTRIESGRTVCAHKSRASLLMADRGIVKHCAYDARANVYLP